MTFVQIIDYKTRRQDDLNQLLDRYIAQSQGKRTVTHSVVGKDREAENHYVDVVEFPSYEDAMKNSQLPETDKMFQEMVALCEGMPTFTNLDVVRDENLNKMLVNRVFEEILQGGNMALIDECFETNYIDHDLIKEETTVIGRGVMHEDVQMWRGAFDMTFDVTAQLAEGDFVTTVWTWHGTHKGEFMGVAPTGKTYDITGTTTFRCMNGEIMEGWWHFDVGRLMREMGVSGS
ncbi:ester cyclase [Streptomyces sp. APSN-46.1]|uniref:ester cyclase n=1 Tax=Streptomyces sp. APSN-46.1 TaxID=2929049 RepID=UPI001FB30A44|nr:ester cyclase [Streptomyces sp. APSN-46.1]MCJ1679450.1 ester cyclase [Streptomyces sp. APSN-46.1]